MHTLLFVEGSAQLAADLGAVLPVGEHHIHTLLSRGQLAPALRANRQATALVSASRLPESLAALRSARREGWTGALLLAAENAEQSRRFGDLALELGATVLDRQETAADLLATRLNALAVRPGPRLDAGVAADMEDVLAELRAEYAAALPGQLIELRTTLALAATDPAPAPYVTRLEAMAHRIGGTTGSYGFRALSLAMLRFETLARMTDTPFSERLPELQATLHAAELALADLPAFAPPRPPTPAALLLVGLPGPAGAPLREAAQRLLIPVADAADWGEAARVRAERDVLAVITGIAAAPATAAGLPVDTDLAPLPLGIVGDETNTEQRLAAVASGASVFIGHGESAATCEDAIRRLLSPAPDTARVLLVEDDDHFAAFVSAVLRGVGVQVHVMQTSDDLLTRLDTVRPDLLMLDHVLASATGLELGQAIRLGTRWRHLPILLVTASVDETLEMQAFNAGFDDFIQKPIPADELVGRVLGRLRRARELEAGRELDALTGLLLRRAFVERTNGLFAAASRHGLACSVAILDLDRFKLINDHHGHAAGDQVLARLGRVLRGRFRPEDVRGRWGGEEFVLAFSGCPLAAAGTIVDELRAEFSQSAPPEPDGTRLNATFTAGIAQLGPDGTTLDALLAAADRRLYLGKAAGRNRVVLRG